jgi:hypothetical protein
VGAGWREEEYRAYGYPLPKAADRIRQVEEEVITPLKRASPSVISLSFPEQRNLAFSASVTGEYGE